MPNRMTLITARLLGKINSGSDGFEVEQLLAELRAACEHAEDPVAAERLHSQLVSLMKRSDEAALTERGLNLLIDTTHDLSCTLSLQDLLQKIVHRARGLASANIVWLTILDEQEGVFVNIAIEGNLSPATACMVAPVDRGAVCLITTTKSFFTTQNYLTDNRIRHSADLDRQFAAESIVSLAGFPIIADDKVQGLLFVADRYSRQYSGREISVLGSFAQHAGAAMQNARSFTRLSEALEETELNRRSLESHIQRVETSAQAHDEMMSLLAQGADLLAFMQRMAGQINGSIQYLDTTLTIREEVASDRYDGTLSQALREGEIDQAKLLSALARSRENGRSAILHETDSERALAFALHGGNKRGDSLIVFHTGQIDEIQLRNLERSTVALSIAKLWAEKRETERLIASSTLLRHLVLVSPPDAPTITSIRDRLALSTQQPVQMAIIVLLGLGRAEQTSLIRDAGARLSVLIDLIDDTYLAVGPQKQLGKLLETLSRRSGSAQIGGLFSAPFADLKDSPKHYVKLGSSLRTMQKIAPLNRFIDVADVNLFARIFEGSDPEWISDFVVKTLAPIAARDPRDRAQLKTTLLSFFENQFNIARTAQRLDIHTNTVRQRLETLRYVTGGWDDPAFALELHVALKLDKLTAT